MNIADINITFENNRKAVNIYRKDKNPQRFDSLEELILFVGKQNTVQPQNDYLLKCLQPFPYIDGLVGPMYDGKDVFGNECVRYEDYEVYETLST
jgi:hypothetical protein